MKRRRGLGRWLFVFSSVALCASFCMLPRPAVAQQDPERAKKLAEIKTLDEQIVALYGQRKYKEAIPLTQQLLEINKQVLGEKHPNYVTALNNLVTLYENIGDYPKALEIRKQALGEKHPDYATALNKAGLHYENMGDYAKAEPLYVQALEIRKRVLGDKHPDYATSLNNLAVLYFSMGDYAKAEPLYVQALEIRKQVLGERDPTYATSLNSLAVLYFSMGDYAKAEPRYVQALEIRKQVLGEKHPAYAASLNDLAELYRTKGDYAKAEPLCVRALEIRKQALGEKHPDYAASLNTLALLYKSMGDYAKAEPQYVQALEIRKQVLGEKHPDYANSLNNLAELYDDRGDYAKAEPLLVQALAIRRQVLGEKHPSSATSLNNLAALYFDMGDYTKAEPLYVNALDIDKQVLGEKHPVHAEHLNNLAALYDGMADYAKSEPLYVQALEIFKQVLGEKHPTYAKSLSNLAMMYSAAGRWTAALDPQDHARRVIRRHVARVLPGLGEKEQIAFLQTSDEGRFHKSLSLGMVRREDGAAAKLSAAWILNGKAVIQETLAERSRLARDSNRPETADIAKELKSVRAHLAKLSLTAPKPEAAAKQQEQVRELEQQEQELSRRLAAVTGTQFREEPWVELAEVQKALPSDGALVEIARFNLFDFQAKGKAKKYLPPHYAVWIIPGAGQGNVTIVDLGEAAVIDEAVAAARQAMQQAMGSGSEKGVIVQKGEPEAEQKIQGAFAAVGKLVLDPLLPHLENLPLPTGEGRVEGIRSLILSPDAALWLVPWGALPVGENKYAIEKYKISYVVSGRDLVTKPGAVAKAGPPRIFANPNYDLVAKEIPAALASVLSPGVKSPTNLALIPDAAQLAGLDRQNRSAQLFGRVPLLPGTASEAKAIEPSLAKYAGQPKTYTGDQALEGVIKLLSPPKVLVLSTHGFFLPDQERKSDDKDRLGALGDAKTTNSLLDKEGHAVENPLLRCGLLLAGCNNRDQITDKNLDDGILTGMEIVGVNLRGTELVVLSACETGLGQVRNGEGVAGLRQAFQLAGAKAVVATLWQIPDTQSARLMSDFFINLSSGQSKSDSLRNAQLALIKARRDKTGAAHPFFWAAFTLTGE